MCHYFNGLRGLSFPKRVAFYVLLEGINFIIKRIAKVSKIISQSGFSAVILNVLLYSDVKFSASFINVRGRAILAL